MTQYNFRLRFHLCDGDSIRLDSEEKDLFRAPDGSCIRIKTGNQGTPIQTNSRAALVGGPYESKNAAEQAGLRARHALLAWSIRQRFGVDLGDNKLRSLFTHAGLSQLQAELERPVRNDIHGLDVYEANDSTAFVALNSNIAVGKSGEAFLAEIGTRLSNSSILPEKLALSAELYSLSFFEASFRARFLTLVAAVEALLEPAERPGTVQEFISQTQYEACKLPVDRATKEALRSSLEWLRRESIGQAGRELANTYLGDTLYLGMAARRFFRHCYTLRSEILHTGSPSDVSVDLLSIANVAQQFVGDLLNKILETTIEASTG